MAPSTLETIIACLLVAVIAAQFYYPLWCCVVVPLHKQPRPQPPQQGQSLPLQTPQRERWSRSSSKGHGSPQPLFSAFRRVDKDKQHDRTRGLEPVAEEQTAAPASDANPANDSGVRAFEIVTEWFEAKDSPDGKTKHSREQRHPGLVHIHQATKNPSSSPVERPQSPKKRRMEAVSSVEYDNVEIDDDSSTVPAWFPITLPSPPLTLEADSSDEGSMSPNSFHLSPPSSPSLMIWFPAITEGHRQRRTKTTLQREMCGRGMRGRGEEINRLTLL